MKTLLDIALGRKADIYQEMKKKNIRVHSKELSINNIPLSQYKQISSWGKEGWNLKGENIKNEKSEFGFPGFWNSNDLGI